MEKITTEFDQKIIEHFEHPRNIGEIENPDGFAIVGDPRCGDHIKVWIKVKDDKIYDFKYKVFGCWGAIATTSVVSELAIGTSLKDASKITDDDVIRELNGIPENKQHCSMLGIQGLRTAIAQYLINDNHRKYIERIEHYCSYGYDIPNERDKIVKLIDDLPKDISILDVGTGKGHLALAIARSGRKCISIDISATEIYYAQLNAIYYQLDEYIELRQMDAVKLLFDQHSFDVVLTADFFHHLQNPQPVLTEMLRVCKPGGKIIIADFNESGQKMMSDAFKAEGKEHVFLDGALMNWFETKGLEISSVDNKYEKILMVKMEK